MATPHAFAVPLHRVVGGASALLLLVGFHFLGNAPGVSQWLGQNAPRPKPSRSPTLVNVASEPEVSGRSFQESTKPLPAFAVQDLSASLPRGHFAELATLTQTGAVLATVSPPLLKPLPNGRPSRLPAPRTHAARFQNGKWQLLDVPETANRVIAGDMNDAGDVAALSILYRRGKPPYCRILMYPPNSASYTDIGTLDARYNSPSAPTSSRMRGISETNVSLNNRGTLLAIVNDQTWFRTRSGQIGTLPDGRAFDINNRDVAVGFGRIGDGNAARWRDLLHADTVPPEPLLPTTPPAEGLPALRGVAHCINDTGDVIVSVTTESSNNFRRQGRTAYYRIRANKMQQIAQMRGFQGTRVHINRFGDAVGFSDAEPMAPLSNPYLYRNGELYSLANVAKHAGFVVAQVVDINDAGQLLAYGFRENDLPRRACPLLLTPLSRAASR